MFLAQPRGQPEIVRKSLERCSVEGNQEMFIIGKNFHRGTKVIFQDSEEPDGKVIGEMYKLCRYDSMHLN